MEIGEKYSRDELIKLGWTKIKAIAKAGCEIWTKDTSGGTYIQKIIWRVKTQSIYLMWDNRKEAK